MEEKRLTCSPEVELNHACIMKNLETVRYILKNYPNVNVNWENSEHSHPLHQACIWGTREIVEELLKHPTIDISKKGIVQSTKISPLRRAINYKKLNFIEELIKYAVRNNIPKVINELSSHEKQKKSN